MSSVKWNDAVYQELYGGPRRSAMMPYDPERVTATEVRELQEQHGKGIVECMAGDFVELEAQAIAHLLKDQKIVLHVASGTATCAPTVEVLRTLMEHEIPFDVITEIASSEEAMFNLSYLARKTKTILDRVVDMCKPTRVYRNELVQVHNLRPIPKHINARQAWKKRGKTSKRKGTRK